MLHRRVIAVRGLVQGVGFRPFVHRLATRLDLKGFVRNDAQGATIDVEGEEDALDELVRSLQTEAPFPAAVSGVRQQSKPLCSYDRFTIADSHRDTHDTDAAPVPVTPDLATCAECLEELGDPESRRYRYPFTNCARCGPRFTIMHAVPYDRSRTTMAAFAMCDDCRREYEDPRDRRFHAQPIACPRCGPTLTYRTPERWLDATAVREGALTAALALLRAGGILALKGIGGYHLACDALDVEALRRLRLRKGREAKPLAVMVADAAAARELCRIDEREEELLESAQRPIVLLSQRESHAQHIQCALNELVPAVRTLGVILPYTPLHHLLMAEFGGPLVMTSGNLSEEPICHDDDEARDRLAAIADGFLTHDRRIASPCDDSVLARTPRSGPAGGAAGHALFVRRSRGFAPRHIVLPRPSPEPLVALGGHQKSTFCLVRGGAAVLSHHIGDLAHPAGYVSLRDSIASYERLFGIDARAIAHDLHPDYLSTRLARELSGRSIAVQHHHAHVAACLAEHGLHERAIGIAWDGAGLGSDNAIWGGEFLLVEGASFARLGHLRYVSLPGGDAAARQPWRSAAAHLWSAFEGDLSRAPSAWLSRQEAEKLDALSTVLQSGLAGPPTSSAGRLFDAIASLIGLRDTSRFEAQAAMELEAIADATTERSYPVEVDERAEPWWIDCGPMIRAIAEDISAGRSSSEIAAAFHNAVRDIFVVGAEHARDQTGISLVALSGGVFQNVRLVNAASTALVERGFTPLLHRLVPPNDGGLALGQAWVAACVLRDGAEAPCA